MCSLSSYLSRSTSQLSASYSGPHEVEPEGLCQGHLHLLAPVKPIEALAGEWLPPWEGSTGHLSLVKATTPVRWFSLQGSLLPL